MNKLLDGHKSFFIRTRRPQIAMTKVQQVVGRRWYRRVVHVAVSAVMNDDGYSYSTSDAFDSSHF
jgi:hypothetical protein